MKSLLTKPKYDGYQIKCRTCQCKFFVPFDGVIKSGLWDEISWVSCPSCQKRIEQSIFWKKHKIDIE